MPSLTLPTLVERPAQPFVAIPESVTLPFDDAVQRVLPEGEAWLAAHGVAPSGPMFFKYDRIDMPHLDIAFGWPTDTRMGGDGRMTSGELPAGRFISAIYHGHYDGLMAATGMLIGWAKEAGVRWDSRQTPNGDAFACRLEIYHTDPMTEPDPERWVTELLFKIADDSRLP